VLALMLLVLAYALARIDPAAWGREPARVG
jgi:hypothetical protein